MELRKLTHDRVIDKLINNRKIVVACLELVSPIFFFVYFLFIGFPWLYILFMLSIHIISLIFDIKEKQKKLGHLFGIVFNSIYLIMILGFITYLTNNDFNTSQYPAGEKEFRTGIFNFVLVILAEIFNTMTAIVLLINVKKF
ncbi:hypothetical protein M670_03091 [Schinkia azotoformans MEV2011]|uniref:Uncharacterized protein n=1 Tax=Schinkia azotoformans MEV2011 TaxID=1348973 RepID=A0A072NX32_SCHAZ|nr:hypothetical protein [Schinkia azotoformans]KEF37785.1 hypothetical protein M670_03091 [Schinkia azotoformans MEV2011]MEC1694678.1 hypothetical protein [Schinkia azotoformans]MEC1718527.1 hypothetical protein [Schinkia azotoformans]MEC1724014.1 hypothetical protein [Schinkia azotoformans]MEC1743074.1 hypothetical protein [Schinkia azotoformans]